MSNEIDSPERNSKLRVVFLGSPLTYTTWWLILTILVIVICGIVLWKSSRINFEWLQRVAPTVRPDGWGQLFGLYLFTIVGMHLIIHPVLLGVRHLFGLPSKKREIVWGPTLVSICESILYPTSLLFGAPEFIGVWLAIKVAGAWNLWQRDHEGRARFQNLLVRNALSILLSLVAFGTMKAGFMAPLSC